MKEAGRENDVRDSVVAGGGAGNLALVEAIQSTKQGQRAAPATVLSDEFGVPVEAREALAMAVLGAMCADGVPITLPQVTGCRTPAPVAGTWCGAIEGNRPAR